MEHPVAMRQNQNPALVVDLEESLEAVALGLAEAWLEVVAKGLVAELLVAVEVVDLVEV